MHRLLMAAIAAVLVAGPSGVAYARAAELAPAGGNPVAIFEGSEIDLSKGWGDAHACLVWRGSAECFRGRNGLLARERQIEAEQAAAPLVATATCSSPLRLYADSGFGGRELDFYDRSYWQNLSTWSFDNQLSSFKVGACAVYLADGANGGSPLYPGNTGAGHNEPALVSGWNDRVSSIYVR